jgi:hypothetical protein
MLWLGGAFTLGQEGALIGRLNPEEKEPVKRGDQSDIKTA